MMNQALANIALGIATLLTSAGTAHASEDLLRALADKNCSGCKLQDADLVFADLRDAHLQKAQLQRANLSRARLDGSNLRGANLNHATMVGASLRGADLRGAQLIGADLRESDLSGAQFDSEALASAHWEGAIGVSVDASSYAAMHNAGVAAAERGRLTEAENFFSKALTKKQDAAVTWLSRGIIRSEQAQMNAAHTDLLYAAKLFAAEGDLTLAKDIRQAVERQRKATKRQNGNGWGNQVFSSAAGLFRQLAPIAMKYFIPAAF